MVVSTTPPANNFVRLARKVYNPVGFGKGYNFVLWFIFAGALMGFTLARFQFLNYNGVFCSLTFGSDHAAPGECYEYEKHSKYKVGIMLHLATILPAGFLVCFQFTPVIRHKFLLFHRINGYVVLVLSLASTIGAFMIAKPSFGGGVETQMGIGALGIMFLASLLLAVINVKRLQIEQHRAWMLRAWFYAGSIITLRIIMIISTTIDSGRGLYYSWPCMKIATLFPTKELFFSQYPICEQDMTQWAAVEGDMNTFGPNMGSALDAHFGASLWLALAIHAIGVEVYLRLTPREAERLRNVSYQRQLEAGMKNPGSAGLTADKLGDAEPWKPSGAEREDSGEQDGQRLNKFEAPGSDRERTASPTGTSDQ